MKRSRIFSPVCKRVCWVLPGIVIAAVMLGAMIIHMDVAFARLHSEPVCSFYPEKLPEQGALFFPCAIQETSLVAERLASYEGPYVEDGSNEEVTGVAALVLHNRGEKTVISAKVTLRQGEHAMTFLAQTIPPGDRVLVLETDRQLYSAARFYSCSAEAFEEEGILLAPEDLQVTVSRMNCITITNRTDRLLTDVCLEHKGWLDEPGICVGGITYVTRVGELSPGQTVSVFVDHFAEGYSRIVRITCK